MYTVLINALIGCGIVSSFPQFSMTIGDLAEKSGLSYGVLMTGDTVKSVGIVLGMLVSGFFYNRFGQTKVFVFSMVASILPQFLILHVSSVFLFMGLKFIQGTAAIIFPVFLVIILNRVSEKNAGISTAVFNGIFYAGGGIGGTMAGFVIAEYGWAASYYVLGAVQIVTGLVWLFTVKEVPRKNAAPVVSGADRNFMASPVLWLLALSFFATTWGVQAITVDWAIYGEWLGYDELSLGKVMSAVTAGMILSCVFSGKTSDFFSFGSEKKGQRRLFVLMAGHLLIIVSVCFLIFGDMKNFNLFYAATFLFAFSCSWGLGAFYAILPEIYDEKKVPVVTGVAGGVGDMGMPLAPMVVGVYFGLKGLWDVGWVSCAVIACLGFIAGIALLFILRKKPLLHE